MIEISRYTEVTSSCAGVMRYNLTSNSILVVVQSLSISRTHFDYFGLNKLSLYEN